MSNLPSATTINPDLRDRNIESLSPFNDPTSQLLKKGAIIGNPSPSSDKSYRIDYNLAVEILEQVAADNELNTGHEPKQEEQMEATHLSTHKILRGVIKDLVESGVIPSNLAYWVGTLVRPQTTIPTQSISRYTLHHCFPENNIRGMKNLIKLGEQQIADYAKLLEEAASRHNCHHILTPDMCRQIAGHTIAAHEYGHALEHTLVLLRCRALNISSESGFKYVRGAFREEIPKSNAILDKMLTGLHIINNRIINRIYGGERFATGIEKMWLQNALLKLGLSENTAREIASSISGEDSDYIKWSLGLLQIINARNLNILTLSDALIDLRLQLRRSGQEKLEKYLLKKEPLYYILVKLPFSESSIRRAIDTTTIPSPPGVGK